jgi:HK97 family phage major capsid protein
VTITSINDLIASINREKRDVQRRHKDARDRAHDIIQQAQAEGRANLTDDESKRFDALLKQSREAADQLDQIDDRLDECRTVALESAENEKAARDVKPSGARKPSYDRVARVGSEERVYRRDDQRTGRPSFLRDLALGQCFADPAANDRLSRHAREVEVDGLAGPQQMRAIGTGNVAGLTPPQYLVELWAELARAGRPVANAVASLPLPPDGMSVNISRITTGTSAASQASENAAVSETNADDTLLTVPVVTVAGQQTVSRQAVERGTLSEQVLTADLANAHNSELDRQVINGSGASGQHLGILGTSGSILVTYTDATPTAQEAWPKIVDAVRQVPAQRFAGADTLIFNPLAWGWLLSTLDTSGRPLFAVGGSEGAFNTMGGSDSAGYELSGRMLGCNVVVSGNLPTNLGGGSNETRIIAMRASDQFLWEDPSAPVYIRAEQPSAASLGVLFVVYSYSAFTAGRQPKSVAVVSGTGLILPAL